MATLAPRSTATTAVRPSTSLASFFIISLLIGGVESVRRTPGESHNPALDPSGHRVNDNDAGGTRPLDLPHADRRDGRRRQLQEVEPAEPLLTPTPRSVREDVERWAQQQQHQQRATLDQNTGPASPEEHLVTSLPYLPPGAFPTKHYAGHIPASADDDKKLFYWLFEPLMPSDGDKKDVPLLIWLNGGPGCSSMDGLWLENGPFRLAHDGKDWVININEHSWHTSPAYTLYIDQPVGTGLSFTKKKKYCRNDYEINVDFHYFLQQFLLLYKDSFLDDVGGGRYQLNRQLFFSGESHAGHYIPSMMDYILQRNDDKSNPPTVEIPLSGAAIGNGWTDPYHQYAAATAAYGMGLIDFAQKANYDAMEIDCQKAMDKGNLDAGVCFKLLDEIVDQSHGTNSNLKVSQYDNRKWERKGRPRTFPPGHKDVEAYLGGFSATPHMSVDYKDVLAAIHASESIVAQQRYEECTDPPFNALSHQDGLGVVRELVRVLDHPTKPKLLFFNGINDLICNHAGNEKLLDMLPWSKAESWTVEKRYAWDALGKDQGENGMPSGWVKEYDNLSFLKVLESGHMVPMDQPVVSLAMMRTLMTGGSFKVSEQRISRKHPSDSLEGELGKAHCDPCPECPAPSGGGTSPASTPTSPSSAGVDPGPVRRSVISGAWLGATAALLLVGLFVVIRRRRRSSRSGVVGVSVEDPDFDLELREHSMTNGGTEYHDQPPGADASSVSESETEGVGASIHSTSSGGII